MDWGIGNSISTTRLSHTKESGGTDVTIVAKMTDGQKLTEVALDENNSIYYRNAGARKWHPVHMGLNPDLDTYLARCANMGYEIYREEN